jgi:hypothetical protein
LQYWPVVSYQKVEGAPANPKIAVNCFPSFREILLIFLQRSTGIGRRLPFGLGNVGLLLNPYPPHYRAAFAFSGLLLSHNQQRALRFRLPQ